MRRPGQLILLLIAAALLAPAAADARVRLSVSAITEPPDRIVRGGTWRATVTVANEGTTRSTSQSVVFYLSSGRRFSSDDLTRILSRRISFGRIRAGRQLTKSATLTVPTTTATTTIGGGSYALPIVPDGRYFLVSCLGRAKLNSDNLNCRFSGQEMQIGSLGPGPGGTPGAPGAKGPKGDKGADNTTLVRVPRATLDTGFANFNEGETAPHAVTGTPPITDIATEGSTQTVELAKVGPLTFTGICREGLPWEQLHREARRDEAKVLVTHDVAGAFMSFRGIMGSRANIPAGRGTAGADNALGGEGQHQVLATFRQEDEGFSDQPAATDEDISGFQAGATYITVSNGWEVAFSGFAGIDVLGAGTPDHLQTDFPDDDQSDKTGEDDRCIFGGFARVISIGS